MQTTQPPPNRQENSTVWPQQCPMFVKPLRTICLFADMSDIAGSFSRLNWDPAIVVLPLIIIIKKHMCTAVQVTMGFHIRMTLTALAFMGRLNCSSGGTQDAI